MNTKKNKSKNTKKKTIKHKKVHGGSQELWNTIKFKLANINYCSVTKFCEKKNGDMKTQHHTPYTYRPDTREINSYIDRIDGDKLRETLELIDKLPNSYINEIDDNGTTLLHIICKRKPPVSKLWTIHIAKKLMEKGADTSIPDKDNKIPLHYAVIINGNDWCDNDKDESVNPEKFINLIELLLEYGSDPNFEDNKGITPFHSLYIENLKNTGEGSFSDSTRLTQSAGNFKSVYKAAIHLIEHGGDINKKIPENYTEFWNRGTGYHPFRYSNKNVIDIVKFVYNYKFSGHHPGFGLRNIIYNMEELDNKVEPLRDELIKMRERLKEIKQIKKHNIEQGAYSIQMSALETFFKNIKDTPIYKVIINHDITSDARKELKDCLDKMAKKYSKEHIIDHKDENLKKIIEIIPKFIEILEKEKEMEIQELNKLSLSLNIFTNKEPEFYKTEFKYRNIELDDGSRPKRSKRNKKRIAKSVDEFDPDMREWEGQEDEEDRQLMTDWIKEHPKWTKDNQRTTEVAEEKSIFKFGDEVLEPPIIPVVNLNAPNLSSKKITKNIKVNK